MTGDQLRETVEQLFQPVPHRSTATELAFVCPQPGCTDSSGHRSVNLKTGQTNCWICGVGGDFVRWAQRLGYAVTEEHRVTKPMEEAEFDRISRTPVNDLPVVTNIKLPKGFRLCRDYPNSVYTEFIAEMAERKGLKIDDLMSVSVGFTKTDPLWEPYAIFPSFEYDKVVYYQGRTYVDEPDQKTKKFPSRREVPYSAKYWVYGIDELRAERPETVLVMESILNVLTMRRFMRRHKIKGVGTACVFSHSISEPQATKLRQLEFLKEVVLLFDHDATRRGWQKSPRLGNKFNLTIADMPPGPGGEKNDPNDDPEGAWRAFEKREHVNTVLAAGADMFDFDREPLDADSFTRRRRS